VSSLDFGDGVPDQFVDAIKSALHGIRECTGTSSNHAYSCCGIRSAVNDITMDLPDLYESIFGQGLVFAARALQDALAREHSIINLKNDSDLFSYQVPEPDVGTTVSKRLITRLECLEILAAGFFGILMREGWGRCKRSIRDMPAFTFEKLWEYNSEKWGVKNFVLMALLLYFWQASKIGPERLKAETLTLIRKAHGPLLVSDESALFCPLDLQPDKVSITSFTGVNHLQADFANKYIGGGVLGGGGTQEESMFLEYTELLATCFLVERMQDFEAVEIEGAKRYVQHNMTAARHLDKWEEQFCHPVDLETEASTAVVVAMDALNFNAYRARYKFEQYQPHNIQREIRKCFAALSSPTTSESSTKRTFVTGAWGCGAFYGDIELKCMIQWICCSLQPSLASMTLCPFDHHQQLIEGGLADLLAVLPGRVQVKKVLELLVGDPDYLRSRSTFQYLLRKLDNYRPANKRTGW